MKKTLKLTLVVLLWISLKSLIYWVLTLVLLKSVWIIYVDVAIVSDKAIGHSVKLHWALRVSSGVVSLANIWLLLQWILLRSQWLVWILAGEDALMMGRVSLEIVSSRGILRPNSVQRYFFHVQFSHILVYHCVYFSWINLNKVFLLFNKLDFGLNFSFPNLQFSFLLV